MVFDPIHYLPLLEQDVQDWKEQAQRKRLTWRGLFGGGKAE